MIFNCDNIYIDKKGGKIMEYTLKKAINQAKKELSRCGLKGAFGSIENVWEAFRQVYLLRSDEKEMFLKSITKYVEKNYIV